ERICACIELLIPLVTAALLLQIFAANITIIASQMDAFVIAVLAIMVFFLLTFGMAEGLTRLFKLRYGERVLLAMTTAARNAPLMLVMTAIAIPNQPVIHTALIIGILVEFTHLTLMKQLLLHTTRIRVRKSPVR
ncbi:MAG: hypothetical protein AAF412_09340, partial [Pseudomonadota bacterium]